MRVTRFCVICAQRSGSTWLIDLLASSPQITAYGEVLLDRLERPDPAQRRAAPEIRHLEPPLARPPAHAPLLVRSVETARFLWQLEASRSEPGAVGYKVMCDQLRRRPELLLCFVARRYRVIHLVRDNVLERLVSERLAAEQGVYHATRDQPLRRTTLHLPTLLRELRAGRKRVQRTRAWLRGLPVRQLELSYEALRANPSSELRRIEQLLQLPGALTSVHSALQRVAPAPLRDKIENYDAVVSLLRGTEFEPLLDGTRA